MTGSNGRQQVFFIHGGSSYPHYQEYLELLQTKEIRDLPGLKVLKKWSKTLREDLGGEYEVFMPSMPNSHNAKYEEWKIWFERHFDHITNDIILVGWSLGGHFLVKYLTENNLPVRVKALFLVAAPYVMSGEGGDRGFDIDISRVGELFTKVSKIIILHSKDDFVVPYEHALQYKAQLPEAKLITFEDKNHFLTEDFAELLDMIRDV